MAYLRGFKTWANKVADEVRGELGLGPFERLDPLLLAESLGISIVNFSDLADDAPAVSHFLEVEASTFLAVTVFDGSRRAIVHNDTHTPVRQASNICHEIGHGLPGHPPTPALDEIGCRIFNQDIEDEASFLGGCLLIPESAALAIARGKWTLAEAALRFGVSPQMVRYRLNATGAEVRARRAAAARAGAR